MVEKEQKFKLSDRQVVNLLSYINFYDTTDDLSLITSKIKQYYLQVEADYEFRIREIDNNYRLTIKSKTDDLQVRNEFEIVLPATITHEINFNKLPYISKERITVIENNISGIKQPILFTIDRDIKYHSVNNNYFKYFPYNIIEIEDYQLKNLEESSYFDLYFKIKNEYKEVTYDLNFYNGAIFYNLHDYNQFDTYQYEVLDMVKDYLNEFKQVYSDILSPEIEKLIKNI